MINKMLKIVKKYNHRILMIFFLNQQLFMILNYFIDCKIYTIQILIVSFVKHPEI